VLAFCQLVVLILPFPILSYVPNFFFGSLLIMIMTDLVVEWLWSVREKVSNIEYVICVATFILIQAIGVEYGILAGVVIYMASRKLGLDVGQGSESRKTTTDNDEEEAISLHVGSATYGTADGFNTI
jgi:MFS superfamily sulfate permease-like transporter